MECGNSKLRRRPSRLHSGRRGTPPEALARLRATQLAAHLERAQQSLAASEFEDAISAAEHALLLDPDNPTAAEIIDHARAALDEHSVQELVKRAGELIEAGSTNELFTNPSRKQTEDYITGRFG